MLNLRDLPIGAAAMWCVVAFLIVYGRDVGHGFVKDDFRWIAQSDVRSAADLKYQLTDAPTGFYRPLVSLSFSANRWACGLESRCYGLTNLLLAIACAVAIFWLARAFALPVTGALVASMVWAFNWHGIGMSVLWISGRTALLAVLCSTLGATAFVRRHPWRAAAWCFAAMLAKEEAVLVPAILIAWSVIETWDSAERWPPRAVALFAGLSALLAGTYVVLRVRSGAFTLSTAPPFYQLEFSLRRFVDNAPAYLDRSATFAAAVVVVYALIGRPGLRGAWTVGRPVLFGALWSVGTLAITVFLPVRSSLYACLPSVGVALAVASFMVDRWPAIPVARQRLVTAAALAAPLLLWPILASRNHSAVREADLSSATVAALRQVASEHGAGTSVLIRDDRTESPSLDNAFGTLVQNAADLLVTPPIRVWIDPPPTDTALAGLQAPSAINVVLALQGQSVTVVDLHP